MKNDPRWIRWIESSVISYFANYSVKGGYLFFIEGQIRSPNQATFAEIRFDGPKINEFQATMFRIEYLVAILIEVVQDDTDIYAARRITGFFASLFSDIPIYRYGDEDGDDGTLVGYLILIPENEQPIRVTQFGQIQAANKTAQSSIEANYRIDMLTQ